MAASPVLFDPANSSRPQGARMEWMQVLAALVFICFTSTTFMGGFHTQVLVNAVWKTFLGTWHWDLTGPANFHGRKVGHFFGYGLVALIFRNAWYKSAQAFAWVTKTWLPLFAASLAVASAFTVASLDEFHQTFLPGRVGCLHDVLLDTSGAIVLNAIYWTALARNRRRRIGQQQSDGSGGAA